MHQVRRRAVPLQPMNMNFMQQLPLARPDTGTSNALLIGSCKFPCNYNFFAFFWWLQREKRVHFAVAAVESADWKMHFFHLMSQLASNLFNSSGSFFQ